MRRVVDLWLALLGAYWLTRAGASALWFGRVDQSYPALVELLVIPALQAAALTWATRQPGNVQQPGGGDDAHGERQARAAARESGGALGGEPA
jgi:hypothetical protein